MCFPGCVSNDEESVELIGTEYKNPPPAPDFMLINQNGEVVTFSDYEDKVIVVAFIYTTCPDVCLVISSNLAYIYDNLGDYSDDVVILSVTIDPARDTVSHLSEWTEKMGYEWNHLTHDSTATIENVWYTWNVVVDDDHIANSSPPEEKTVRFAVLNPDNSSFSTDNKCGSLQNNECYTNGEDMAEYAFNENMNIAYNITEGVIGNWTSNESWNWGLYAWDDGNESWIESNEQELKMLAITKNSHLAWVASNADISNLPPGVDCGGNGWIMGSGPSSHCMCDEGWERGNNDWLSCVLAAEDRNANSSETIDPHAETLGQYEIGHSTSTYIVDKHMNKRLSYSGIFWDVEDFLDDVISLVNE